jgi:hypothetical protein
MATYDNDLRLKEITTGDEDGTWGTSTNTNLDLIADGFSYGTKAMAADADETFTMPDATADATRSLYLKFTSGVSLTATRVVTLGPNTVSKTWIIENATSGSQIITIKQGSGATVNVANGSKVMIVTDGAGAGAAVINATPSGTVGTVTSVAVSGGTTGLTTSGGPITGSGTITVAGTLAVANGGTGITALGTGVAAAIAVNVGSAGAFTTFNGDLGTPSALVLTNATGTLTSATFVTPALGTPASGVLTNTTGLPLTTGVTGTLPVANGGIGATTLAANNVVLGNGTSAVQVVAPSTSGNVLTSNGSTWASTAPAGGGASTYVLITSSGTYTIPSDTIKIYVVGGGGGSGANFSASGGAGGTSSFTYGGFSAINGTGGAGGGPSGTYVCAYGGTGQNGDIFVMGGYGQGGAGSAYTGGTLGGTSALGGNNGGGQGYAAGAAQSYGGGAGGTGGNNSGAASSGGGGGGMAIKYITGQSGVSATIVIGAGGTGGVAGSSNGAAGYQGCVIVEY